jgi:hypothetical protein
MIPEIPQPSSRTLEVLSRIPCLKSGLDEEVIQDANKGVIFQTTDHFSYANDAFRRQVQLTCPRGAPLAI